ncbi:MAG TPA: PAS domain S-box protein [Blastocatellia bacterium]|nr:PAS domain S-box protein [Blastocatellia bacterium]
MRDSELLSNEGFSLLARHALDRCADAVYFIQPDAGICWASQTACRMLGYTSEELLSLSVYDIDPLWSKEQWPTQWTALRQRGWGIAESLHRTRDGRLIPVEISASYVESGGRAFSCAFVRDISERRQAEEARLAEHVFRHSIIENMAEGLCVCHEITDFPFVRFTVWNNRMTEITGYSLEEINRLGWYQTLYPDPELQARAIERMQTMRLGDDLHAEAWEITRADGEKRILRITTSVLRTIDGVAHVMALMDDITERQRAEDALRENEERFRATFEQAAVGMTHLGLDGRFLLVNQKLCEFLGYSREELLTRTFQELTWPEDLAANLTQLRRVLAGEIQTFSMEQRYIRSDGSLVWANLTVSLVRDEAGQPGYFVSVVQDITWRKLAEENLKRNQEMLANAEALAHAGSFEWDLVSNRVTWSDEMYRIYGQSPAQFVPTFEAFLNCVHPDDQQVIHQAIQDALSGRRSFEMEERIIRPDGATRVLATRGVAHFNQHNSPVRLIGICQDITERKLAEAALAESEEQLRQAQKMEAVGRLAGGIAHDFNNLLTAITGYSVLLLKKLGDDSPLRREIEEIHAASERASTLTRQLLAFSRKQILQPQVLDLNYIVTDIEQMLRRLIGEDIELIIRCAPGLRAVRADPGQIEQVLINLAVNSRDAMPQGGTLTIETANCDPEEKPGIPAQPTRAVRLTVTDTGCGMDAETQSRIFEPFFTTREPGKGTGLGLSTVYGIIEQSGGRITVQSAPGQGATFTIFLPAIEEAEEALKVTPETADLPGGTETILLVEDEEMVRRLVSQSLRLVGYHVLEAGSGPQALELCRQYNGPLHLLLTDVVMPQMSGRELAEELKRSHQQLKLLFMSGYTEDRIVTHGLSVSPLSLLQKPFTPETLARRVREVLDEPEAGMPAAIA